MIVWTLFGSLVFGILASSAIFWRWRDKFPPLPQWTWRNIIALIALAATIGGAAVLTDVAWWLLDQMLLMAKALITELMRDPHARPEVGQVLTTIVDAIAWGLKLLLAGVIVVMLSLGIAITPRKIAVSKSGAELSGGDETVLPDTTVAAAAAGAAAGATAAAASSAAAPTPVPAAAPTGPGTAEPGA